MMIDLRTVTEESLLKEISSKIDTLLPVVRKYLIYKILKGIGKKLPDFCRSNWFLNTLMIIVLIGLIIILI